MPPRPAVAAFALAAALVAALVASGPAGAFTLDILHVNDVHSRIEPVNKTDATCSQDAAAAGDCLGGAARLFAAITAERKAIEDAGGTVLVLDGGDEFQGSLFFSTYAGQAELQVMNAIGFDAMVVGNHEFDLGPAPLAAFAADADFPLIFGNVDTSKDPKLAPFGRGPVILTVGGERVALIGAVTPETATISAPGPTLSFEDPIAYLTRMVADLEAQGITHIIALTHQGVGADIRTAERVPGLDAIVGGHSHTLFSNTLPGAALEYPHMVTGPEGRAVPVVSAGSYSKYLGHLRLVFDDVGHVTAATGDTTRLDAGTTPDPAMVERVRKLAAPIEELKARVVAEVAHPIDGSRETCRAAECAMGDLVAEAMLARVAEQGGDVAIQNGGGLSASIAAGKVTKGDVLAVLPFQNTLATFNLTGAGIVAALENGVSQVEEAGGRFPQVAGLTFAFDAKVAPMQGRVRDVRVREGDAWVPLDPAKIYTVATNNFLRGGGDGYEVFRDEGRNAYDFGPNLEDVLADYLADHPDYEPATDGRITRME